jgi:hypothetical protein
MPFAGLGERQGYLRFSDLHALVERDRRHCAGFEHELLAIRQKENANLTRDRIKETLTDAEDEIFPANNLGGLAYPTSTAEETKSSDNDSS